MCGGDRWTDGRTEGWAAGRRPGVNTSTAKASVGPHRALARLGRYTRNHIYAHTWSKYPPTSYITHVTCSWEQGSCISFHTLPRPPPFHALPLLTLSLTSPSLSHCLQVPGSHGWELLTPLLVPATPVSRAGAGRGQGPGRGPPKPGARAGPSAWPLAPGAGAEGLLERRAQREGLRLWKMLKQAAPWPLLGSCCPA